MNLDTSIMQIVQETKKVISSDTVIETGKAIEPLLKGFRGKQGKAIAAVYPTSVAEMYQLIKLYGQLDVGYILQGANTALKGQGTPNGENRNVVIIKTQQLNHIKVLDFPNTDEYKVLLVQPGVSLKQVEVVLNKLNFGLPHKTGSHDLGNTFGASCANACGGLAVDNRDGRPSLTRTGNMGSIAISAEGLIYNGFINPDSIQSGAELLKRIDENSIEIEDILLPDIHEIDEFLKKLFFEKSYPIRNHRGEIIFSGDGGEGSQAIVYQMYLIRKKPKKVNTYVLLFSKGIKQKFYQDVVFSEGSEHPGSLPTLCESMNKDLVKEIVNNGYGFFSATILATECHFVAQYTTQLLNFRSRLIRLIPQLYITLECLLGKCLSYIFTPRAIRQGKFNELLVLQVSDRENNEGNIAVFEKKLADFYKDNEQNLQVLNIKSGTFAEKMMLETRTTAALATLTLSTKVNGELFPFDDAIMPGEMMQKYCDLLREKLSEQFSKTCSISILGPYLYGHDLKQINHNDWIIKGNFSSEQLRQIHHIQLEVMEEVGGHAHAEHGVGDYADTDLNREELVKLVVHRLLNDIKGIANPGGGPERAFKKACADNSIVNDALAFAQKVIERENTRGTLWHWDKKVELAELETILKKNKDLL